MNSGALIGQVVDGKYKIERQLGKGGMGTVYLATHLGTERPVAVKVIAPQFMQRAEFVERFRREARAAGRLRHPNVVDVTDFGIADGPNGRIAYLVMEYLDGCTLGEVLEEEGKLPLSFTLDILEQVCSAVHAAHEQGIIHRDLKPDNIWLEPNQRGGYTVKVLDFGIAKLEENHHGGAGGESDSDIHISGLPTSSYDSPETAAGGGATLLSDKGTAILSVSSEKGTAIIEPVGEAGTAIMNPSPATEGATALIDTAAPPEEAGTAIFPERKTQILVREAGTLIVDAAKEAGRAATAAPANDGLTRAGAVLGTPYYMSPEQCRGEKLGPQSDVYSLGVIAYQMLGGARPFEGEFTTVMRDHKETPPPPLVVKKVPRKVKLVVHSSLSKDPAGRPQSAEAFATQMTAQSSGITGLIRRSLVTYTEHLPQFLGITTIFLLPVFAFTFAGIIFSFLRTFSVIDADVGEAAMGLSSFLMYIAAQFFTSVSIGATTFLVAQNLAVPLRPVRVRPALRAVSKKWRAFAWTAFLHTVLTHLGMLLCFLPFLVLLVVWSLFASVVMMENMSGMKALSRSYHLVKRSVRTSVAAILLMFVVPALISSVIFIFVGVTTKLIETETAKAATAIEKSVDSNPAAAPPSGADDASKSSDQAGKKRDVNFNFNGKRLDFNDEGKDMRTRIIHTVMSSLVQIIWLPLHIFVASFTSIILALLYLKTRQVGGEPLRDLLVQFEEADKPRARWQQRVQDRLVNSGRVTTGKT